MITIDHTPYPDPHIPVTDYTTIQPGDVIRYTARHHHHGHRIDTDDYIVTAVDTTPRDLGDGTPLTFPCHRLHVRAVTPPDEHAASRTISDARPHATTTRIVDTTDTIVRADRRAAAHLVDAAAHTPNR
ncbi:MAG: hypothetical protein WAX14_02020 [Rhodococcus sp. (in: high G+C Gram-positive bacteria)]|uniref:hypothetical protein n=1 Tax=Rhodococcus sp. TaxID=1831 RepID=UPI003BB6551A